MMVREWGATILVDKQAKALNLASAAVLLIGTVIVAGPALAQTPDPCPNGQLSVGTGQDIVINHPCTVGMGTYNYGNVNIIAKGSLVFEENVPNEKIDFWIDPGGEWGQSSHPQPQCRVPVLRAIRDFRRGAHHTSLRR
jgi:hypothetical protein